MESEKDKRQQAGKFEDSDVLYREILAGVSRSFYLTLKWMPAKVRKQLSLAYLLARATDTVADAEDRPAEIRVPVLQQMQAAIQEVSPERAARIDFHPVLDSTLPNPGERELLSKFSVCVGLMQEFDEQDQTLIREVLATITGGQIEDIEFFSHTSPTSHTSGVRCLADTNALDRYTYQVAGSVGEFWTKLCLRHFPTYSPVLPEDLIRLGIHFGKALQLTNILRDLPEDLTRGRCYFPESEMGVVPATSSDIPARVFQFHRKVAYGYFSDACIYTASLNSFRMRFACYLPILLGKATLDLLGEIPPEEKIKVPRSEVRGMLCKAVLGAIFPRRILR